MPWKKGQSGNPQGRRIDLAHKRIEAATESNEAVYIPILDKRDPAKELIKLADNHTDKRYKMEIWMFLFSQKYKASKIVSKPVVKAEDSAESDEAMIRALEGKEPIKPLESNPDALSVKPTATLKASE